jgi:hypothetical protein
MASSWCRWVLMNGWWAGQGRLGGLVPGLQARGSGERIVPSRSEHHRGSVLSGSSSFIVVV